jgi:hypothetical protein
MAIEKVIIDISASEMAEMEAWLREHLPKLEQIIEDTRRTQDEIVRLREENRALLNQIESRL